MASGGIKGRGDEAQERKKKRSKSEIKCDQGYWKFVLILSRLVYSAHLNRSSSFLTGLRLGAWELDASLCVFINAGEMALGWAQAVCLCAYCSL